MVTSASVLVRDLLVGPVRRASVVATGPMATYLDVDGRFLAVVAAGGVRLPCAVMLGPGVRPPVGPDVVVGDDHIVAASWFDPRVRVGRGDGGQLPLGVDTTQLVRGVGVGEGAIAPEEGAKVPATFQAVGAKRDVLRLALRELHRAAPAPVGADMCRSGSRVLLGGR